MEREIDTLINSPTLKIWKVVIVRFVLNKASITRLLQ